MCGIAGVIAREPILVDEAAVLASLAHRGPDGGAVEAWQGPSSCWTLAHTRLAINDLSAAGAQPATSASGRYCMVFNGEIYNYPTLRAWCEARGRRFTSRMDGEVILHLLEMEGTSAFERLNGIFAIAVADRVSGQLLLVRDPLGVKPLFYALGRGGELRFASELPALRAVGANFLGYDAVALGQFLTFLWVPAPRTPFRGIHALEPGHLLEWSPSAGSTVRRYRSPVLDAVAASDADPRDVERGVGAALHEAVSRQLLSDVPVGLMASGGIDSGLVWAAAGNSLAAAFSVTWTGAARDDDAVRVRALASRWDASLVEVAGPRTSLDVLPPSGDLIADPAYVLADAVAAAARDRSIPVLFSGQGGDELFGGYRRHIVARLLQRRSWIRSPSRVVSLLARLAPQDVRAEYAARLLTAVAERDPFAGYLRLSSYSTAEQRAAALGCTTEEVSDDVMWSVHRELYDGLPPSLEFTRKAMALDLGVYLPGLGLAYNDRAGMRHGVEVRVPWLDLDLVRWSLTVPISSLFRRFQGKQVTRRLAAERIGRDFATAPKRGFGAPSEVMRAYAPGSGDGFRQDWYLAYATAMLDRYRSATGAALLATPAGGTSWEPRTRITTSEDDLQRR